MRRALGLAVAGILSFVAAAQADTPVQILGDLAGLAPAQIQNLVQQNIEIETYREVRVQVVPRSTGEADHLLVMLFAKGFHRVDFARLDLAPGLHISAKTLNYRLTDEDHKRQPGSVEGAKCPDPSIQFIAFAPNVDPLEQKVALEVAQAAQAAGLKTVSLLTSQATRQNYLNDLTCPNLIGNFYDGDANPGEIATFDGVLSSDDFNGVLRGAFRYRVTNIWLACFAYNDPMLSAVVHDAQAQKFAAGVNNLAIGSSDEAAACAMKAAIQGKSMSQSFEACYRKYDIKGDQWGFGGAGSNRFGK